jgi:hypothetical protein
MDNCRDSTEYKEIIDRVKKSAKLGFKKKKRKKQL